MTASQSLISRNGQLPVVATLAAVLPRAAWLRYWATIASIF